MLARAKINLSLCVEGRREDGYHRLSGVVAFADVGDELRAAVADELSLVIDGEFAMAVDEGNLVLRAARLLQAECVVADGAALHLTKNLPVAAGIGGGSADAAAALRLLNELWQCGLTEVQLMALGLKLGADVPMCVYGRACAVAGIGEEIVALDAFAPLYAVLVNPAVAVATADVFAGDVEAVSPASVLPEGGFATHSAAHEWLARTGNDLTAAACTIAPEIEVVLAALGESPECQLARMSGSGATCFGLFDSKKAANSAASSLADAHPEWWVTSTCLR